MMLKIELHTPVRDKRAIYIAGSFNRWKADQKAYKLRPIGRNRYRLDVELPSDTTFPMEYKYVREGGWTNVETDQFGNAIGNRLLKSPNDLVTDFVPRWQQDGDAHQEQLLPKPIMIEEEFEIPSKIKTRRIAALLPHDYYTSEKRYPVLYLQDGQNLFDSHAPYGTWGVTKKMAILSEQGMGELIVVAIDHAESERIAEFTPSQPTQLGVGDGKKYVNFLAKTLKPYIDTKFRTLTGPEHTGIGGSSMGGLISAYAGKVYPEIYSKWLIFSPSLWVAPELSYPPETFQYEFKRRVYLYAGGKESENLLSLVEDLADRIQRTSRKEIQQTSLHFNIRPEGEHNEYFWGQEFCLAVEWLFFN